MSKRLSFSLLSCKCTADNDELLRPVSMARRSCVIIDVHTCNCMSIDALGEAICDVTIELNPIHISRTMSRLMLLSKIRNDVEIEF